MFTVGNKEAIINTVAQAVYTPTGATASVVLNIKGFGTFNPTYVTSAKARRASAAQLEKIQITCPTTDQLGIDTAAVNVPVTFKVKVYSLRQASETAIDFIKAGRFLVLEVLLNGNSAASVVATAIGAALTAYSEKFPTSTFPFTSAVSTDYVILTATEGFYSFGEEVIFKAQRNLTPYSATVTRNFDTTLTVDDVAIANGHTTIILSGVTGLSVGDTIQFEASPTTNYLITEIVTLSKTITFTPALATATLPVNANKVYKTQKAVEAIGDGKTMEEEIRMSNVYTSDTYAINPSVVPIIGASYAMVQWTTDTPAASGGWETHATPGIVANAITSETFTLYFNEATCLAGAGVVDQLLVWLNAAGAGAGTITVADFKKANGASSISEDDFIA